MTTDRFIGCQGPLRHAWEDFTPIGKRRPEFGIRLSMVCTRCTAERHDIISRATGQLLSRQYVYPDGYLRSTGEGRPDAAALRLEYLAARRRQMRRMKEGSPDGATIQSS